jgi:plasmid replication initiation protein
MIEDIKSYNRFPSLKQKVLEPAMKEINEYTDIDVTYREILKGRKVIKLEF